MARRIQLKRRRGWRKPPGAVVVARPTRWGDPHTARASPRPVFPATQTRSWLYRIHLHQHPKLVDAARLHLAGRDLACWCPPGQPCHADMLEVANGQVP